MSTIVCPSCGARNADFNPRCTKCDTPLPELSDPADPSLSDSEERAALEHPAPGSEEDPALAPTQDISGGDTLPASASEGPLVAPSDRPRRTGPGAGSVPPRADWLSPGTALGRFVIRERLGEGGMGVVVSAHDPKLDRTVAIKVLHADRDGRADDHSRERLLREAKAMARLTHPNVVTVHEIDVLGSHVAIVMEHVRGRTLRAFLDEKERPVKEIVSAFVEAGRGLVEVHRAGLVHRDFKPENVLVAEGGRVCVTDFGLVGYDQSPSAPDTPSPELSDVRLPLTRSGSLLGTPIYMAPEQHERKPADARADQFAFCVSLYEALYGERPFAGTTYRELVANVLEGRVRPPPRGRHVPAWLRRALLRGLARRPEDRHPSMAALVAALEDDPTRHRGRWLAAAAAAGLVALSVYSLSRKPSASLCQGGEARLAGVWDAAVRERVKRAFAGTNRPYSDDTRQRVEKILDERAGAWVTMYTDSCEATHVRGEQSPQLLDLRTRCLERRRAELSALTSLLSLDPDADVLSKAIDAALALPKVDVCADPEALGAAVPPPESPEARAKIDAVLARVEEARALDLTGKHAVGLPIAKAAAEEARGLGHPPLEATALLVLGKLQRAAGDAKGAEPTLRDASTAAAKARDDRLLAAVWTELMDVTGVRLARFADAMALEPVATAAVERAGGDVELRSRLLGTLADVLDRKGDSRAGLEKAQQAISILEGARGKEAPQLPVLLNVLSNCLVGLDRYSEAQAALERAIAIAERVYGAEHPSTGLSHNNLGALFGRRGQNDKALPHLQRAAEILEKTQGPEHPSLGPTLNGLGLVLTDLGRYGEALRYHERALAIWNKTLRPDHPSIGSSLNNIGNVLFMQERYAEAIPYFQRSLAVKEKTFGPDHPRVASSLFNLGNALVGQGKAAEALPHLERATAILEKSGGGDSLDLGQGLQILGECLVVMKEPAKGRPILERSLAILEKAGADASPVVRAGAEFMLARALWETGGDRKRAVQLATRARDTYEREGSAQRSRLVVAQAWLKNAGVTARP